MSDAAIAQELIEPVPPVPPGSEATAEVETAAPQADTTADDSFPHDPENPGSAATERVLPEIEHAIGATRQRILDEFLDSDTAELSMSQIKSLLPDVLPGTVEACVRREWQQGRLERIKPGVYRLTPKPPAEAPKPSPPPEDEQIWFSALEAFFVDPTSWDEEEFGPSPDQPNHRIPPDVVTRMNDRLRKREARRRDVVETARRRAEADAALRHQLLAATGGNHTPALVADDLAPIKSALELVDLDTILIAIRGKLDLCWPPPPPLKEWREPRLLEAIAKMYCRHLGRRLVAVWSAAKAQKGADASEPLPAVPAPSDPATRPGW
jgi:hypothetical protein